MIRFAKRNGRHKRNGKPLFIENVVKRRYAAGARRRETGLCCPVSYDSKYLKVLPKEILQKDYGCGDPTPYLREGDMVLDLGSGAGKICYIASQIVGPKGKVIGIDFNPPMLALARKYQNEIAERIGWSNVEFRWGRVQDLKTDLEILEKHLAGTPIHSLEDYFDFQESAAGVQREAPLIEDDSVDVIVSNCVLNLVRLQDKAQLFQEMYRVLKIGGRVAISDIVSDEKVPANLQRNPKLWSGCISGAFQEMDFLRAFEESGFYGIKIEKWDTKPWRTVRGIEFRSVMVTACKGKEGPCWERNQAVIYKGPWKQVEDDDRHILRRGIRTAVCDKTFQIFSKAPYAKDLIFIPPRKNIALAHAKPFSATTKADPSSGGDCSRSAERSPRETKGTRDKKTAESPSVCLGGSCC
jgi:SAM-dependent methyltransferase